MSPQVETAPVQETAQVETLTEQQSVSLLEQAMSRPVSQENEAFDMALRYAAPAADSRFWSDAAGVPQALMKILAGRELGLSPIVSLQAVNIIKGKVGISGDMIATKLRQAGYTWGFFKHDADGCTLAWYKGWNADGTPKPMIDPATGKQVLVEFHRKDAERAELVEKGDGSKKTSGMYDKYPKSMYFNRCLAFFRRWYAPEVTNGVNVFVPDELEDAPASADSATQSQAEALRARISNIKSEKVVA